MGKCGRDSIHVLIVDSSGMRMALAAADILLKVHDGGVTASGVTGGGVTWMAGEGFCGDPVLGRRAGRIRRTWGCVGPRAPDERTS